MKPSFECRHCGARVVAHQVSEAPPSQCPMCRGPLKQLSAAAGGKEDNPGGRRSVPRVLITGPGGRS